MRLSAISRWTTAPFHPLIFSVFPVISLYAANLGKGYLGEALAIAAGLVIVVTVLWLLLNLLTRRPAGSAIILTALLVLFFSYGHVMSALDAILDKLHLTGQTQFLVRGETSLIVWLVLGAILLFAIARYALRNAGKLGTMTRFLNTVALALLVISGLNLAYNSLSFYVIPRVRAEMEEPPTTTADQDPDSFDAGDSQDPADAESLDATDDGRGVNEFISAWRQALPTEGVAVSSAPPDIYYIVVDAYARQDILQSLFGHDNSKFIDYLVDRGFYVADYSTANYPQTALSLASSLNMVYLDGVIEKVGTHTSDRMPLAAMIKQCKIFSLFRNSGYKLMAFDSGVFATQITRADLFLSPPTGWSPSEFQEGLIMYTPLSVFRATVADFRRERILYAFDHIPDAARDGGPTFVFAHLLLPHFPFIFDAEGRPIEPRKGVGARSDYGYDEYTEGYTDQLVFASNRLMALIDAILSQSTLPPIIIPQSDHGSAAQLGDAWNVTETNLPERLSILNAYYFPDHDYAGLYKEISPVNTFRVVLSKYFGMDYDLLEDRAYFSIWLRPYDLTEVTSEVRREN